MTGQFGKRKKILAPAEKYEIWMQLVRGETTPAQAASKAGVDRSTIGHLRDVARQGALDALAQSRPGRRGQVADHELVAANAEIDRLRRALAEMAVKLTLAEGKEPWG